MDIYVSVLYMKLLTVSCRTVLRALVHRVVLLHYYFAGETDTCVSLGATTHLLYFASAIHNTI